MSTSEHPTHPIPEAPEPTVVQQASDDSTTQLVGAIVLIDKKERLKVDLEDFNTRFVYRRLPEDERERIVKENTDRGKTDEDACAIDSFKYCLLDWMLIDESKPGGIRDLRGKLLPFDEDLIVHLPQSIRGLLAKQIFGTAGGEEVTSDPLTISGSIFGP